MSGWMNGQVALVTGGGSGIGRAVVDAFVAEGARVGILEIDAEKRANLNAAHGIAVHTVAGNVCSFADNQRLVAETVSAFGAVDTLVCVAGIWDYKVSLLDFPVDKLDASFDEIFAVNVKAVMLAVKAAADELIRNGGSVVLTVSTSGFYPDGGGPLYAASKFAVRGLVGQLAFELAPKVRVNGVAPGGTVTKLRGMGALGQDHMTLADIPDLAAAIAQETPLHRAGEPADHAAAYVYLAARSKAPVVTGTIIHSDGGMGVRGIGRLAGLVG